MIAWILAVAFVIALALYARERVRLRKLKFDYNLLGQDNEALEIGKDELQETYEQQFLSHLEKISYLQIRVEELETERNTAEGIIVYHSERCHGFVGDTFGRILERMKEAHVMPAEITRPVVQDNLNH